MKKVLLLSVLLLGLKPAQAWNNSVAETMGEVNESRSSVRVTLLNKINADVLCRDVTVKVSFENQGQMVIAHKKYNVPRTYLEKHASKILEVGSDEHQRLAEKNEYVFIRDFEITADSCEPAKLADYCNHAEMNKDEIDTLKRMMEATKTNRCEDVEAVINKKGRLDLSETNIFNMKPLSFLSGLKDLNISRNKIYSIAELAPLYQLVSLNVSYNTALTEIDSVINLPYIEKIDARYTSLRYKQWVKASPKLIKRRGLRVEGTPYAQAEAQQRSGRR